MRPSSRISSARSASGWLIAAAGLVGYVGLVVALPWDRMRLDSPLPWWVAQAAPPILYGALTLICGRRLSAVRWLILTLSLWTVHITLGLLTQLVADPSRLFPPPPVPAILWVPLLLFPLRDVFGGSSTALGARRRPADLRVTPARSVRPEIAQPAKATAAATGAPAQAVAQQEPALPAPKVARSETPVSRPAPPRASATDRSPTSPVLEQTSGRDTSTEMVRVSFNRIAEQLPVNSFKLPLDRMAASLLQPGYLLVPQRLVLAQLLEGVVLVRWDVVSDQFPRQSLGLTDVEIAGHLSDGQLVLPLDEVVSQLPRELFVVANPAVDLSGIESFPAPFQPLSTDEQGEGAADHEPAPVEATAPIVEVARLGGVEAVSAAASLPEYESKIGAEPRAVHELTDLDLDLPLMEPPEPEPVLTESIVSQLPRELFVVANPAVDLSGIESVPAPFQPLSTDEQGEGAADHEPAPVEATAPIVEVARPGGVEAVSAAASLPEYESKIGAEPRAVHELTDLDLDLPLMEPPEPEPVLTESIEPEPSLPPVFELESTVLEQDQAAGAESEWSAVPFTTPAVDGLAAGSTAALVQDATHDHRPSGLEITTLLAPMGLLNLAVDSVDQLSLVVVSAPGIPSQRLTAAARLMLPLLAHAPAWGRPDLLTLRGHDLALVLTPLDSRGAVLVAAAPPTRSLAMLEILCRRAALGRSSDAGPAPEDDDSRDEPDLVEIELSTRIQAITRSLSAVGPVIASTLRDLESEWPVYCFLPPGSDVRAIAAFACETARAVRAAAAESGTTLDTAMVAFGKRRMIIRVASSRSRGGIFVAAGETDRPGLAYRQVASAADTLLVG